MIYFRKSLFALACIFIFTSAMPPYPIDGFDSTGIERLKRIQLIMSGEIKSTMPIPGAQKSIKDIRLNLLGSRGDSLSVYPTVDPVLQKQINALFPNLHDSYSLAVLEISDGDKIRYASRKEAGQYQPGSVGKIAVAVGFFNELNKIYPKSFAMQQELLRKKNVIAGKWAMYDEHPVPIFDVETGKFEKRTIIESDKFSLYEWLDHMLSVSNNGAASVCWRETILMRVFGMNYPDLSEEDANNYFKLTSKAELSTIANSVVNDPLREIGISEDEWRLGALFTKGGGSYIPGKGGSTGSPQGLMKFLIALERGKVIGMESSLEIKRLLYMTDRRIRYASAPSLTDAAVYYKSGSLYQCKQEEGYSCGKYKGNVTNFMNSVAIIEHPGGCTYIVVLMSNILKKNSAGEHQALATRIDKIMRGS